MENQQIIESNKPKLNIGFFFLCLGLLITLITSVVSLLNLIFSVLEKQFPDVLNATYQYGYSSYSYDSIRTSLATLIIFFPIFLVVAFFWRKYQMGGMGHIDEIIKKWVIYIILFLSSIVVAVDLVILVRYFVAGEITNRFIYKVISALLVAFVVGIYYILLLQNKDESKSKKHNIIFGIIAILIFMVSIIYSFLIMGSPAKQRLLRLDEKRVTDLQSIQYQIITYWQQKEKLPENLSVLSNSMNGFSLPVPPEFQNGEKYEFTIKDEKKLTFELCADFSLPIQKGWQENNYTNTMPTSLEINRVGGNESWNHDVGRTCYSRTIDKDIYPPFSKTNK
jgi:hypothetical protein